MNWHTERHGDPDEKRCGAFYPADPKEAAVAKELNRYRHKAAFVAKVDRIRREESGISREELKQIVIDIVKEYLKENTLDAIPGDKEQQEKIQKLDRETASSLKALCRRSEENTVFICRG